MSFPNTVSSIASSAEAPGTYGPFQVGNNYYLILTRWDGTNLSMTANKSTDGGVTWHEMDAADAPQINSNDGGTGFIRNYTACQSSTDPTKIYCVTAAILSIGAIAIQYFDASIDKWGAILATTVPPIFDQVVGQNGYLVCCYRPFDNSVVVCAPADQVTLSGVTHNIPGFSVFSIGSSSFSGWSDFGYVDFSAINNWDLVPIGAACGSDGVVHVIMQQMTWGSNGVIQDESAASSGPWDVPLDCNEVFNVNVWGAGGGCGNDGTTLNASGGGGGGGFSSGAGPYATTPGDTLTVTAGAGGAYSTDGGSSSFMGVSAAGGEAGSLLSGGAGGSGDSSGGDGGDALDDGGSGGGGGGGAGSGGGGGNGGDGVTGIGAGGAAGAFGPGDNAGGEGGGGGDKGSTFGNFGDDGDGPGGGAGGNASGGLGQVPPPTNVGGAGQVTWQYLPYRAGSDGRLWQQAVLTSNALGALSEITQGAMPVLQYQSGAVISLDIKAAAGYIEIAFTGVNSTAYDNILVGKASNADPLAFTFTTISAENSGNEIDATPALGLNGTDVYLFYEASSPSSANFKSRKNGAASTSFGTFAPFSRLCGNYLTGPQITFGTPTFGAGAVESVDISGGMSWQTVEPGLPAQMIGVYVSSVAGGGTVSVTVTEFNFGQYVIEIILGYDAMSGNLNAGDWNAVAAAVNGSAAGAIIQCVGDSGTSPASGGGVSGGSCGGGMGQYYWGLAGKPAASNNYVSSGGGLVGKGNYVA